MDDARNKPLEGTCHADAVSYVAAGTDEADDTEHLTPYTEDSVFKSAIGPFHASAMTRAGAFWVQK